MSDARPKNAIEVRALEKTYPGGKSGAPKRALKGIDLDVPQGAIFGLLGPNGAGKSTFINILAGLVVKTSGTVRIWGFDQDVNPRQSRAAIGVVPQELNLDPFFTPLEALEVQAGLYGVPKRQRRSMEILDRVGLADKAHAYARTLSGGMRRRLLIAKALVHQPAVLVLDEPTAGVDIELRRMLWSFVRELNAGGTTVILTTHYLEEAEEMCGRIAIVNHGEVIACEDKADMMARLDARTLVLDLDEVPEALPDLGPGLQLARRGPSALAITYRKGTIAVPGLILRAQEAGLSVRDVSTEEPDLEDVFVSLTEAPGS